MMNNLRFDFMVKAAGDGKSNIMTLTSIGTRENRNFILPDEYQPMHLHTILEKTKTYSRIRNTLKKGTRKEEYG